MVWTPASYNRFKWDQLSSQPFISTNMMGSLGWRLVLLAGEDWGPICPQHFRKIWRHKNSRIFFECTKFRSKKEFKQAHIMWIGMDVIIINVPIVPFFGFHGIPKSPKHLLFFLKENTQNNRCLKSNLIKKNHSKSHILVLTSGKLTWLAGKWT